MCLGVRYIKSFRVVLKEDVRVVRKAFTSDLLEREKESWLEKKHGDRYQRASAVECWWVSAAKGFQFNFGRATLTEQRYLLPLQMFPSLSLPRCDLSLPHHHILSLNPNNIYKQINLLSLIIYFPNVLCLRFEPVSKKNINAFLKKEKVDGSKWTYVLNWCKGFANKYTKTVVTFLK